MTTNLTYPQARVTDEELDQMIWKLERDGGMTPKLLSLMRELREVRKLASGLRRAVGIVPLTDDEMSLLLNAEKLNQPVSETEALPSGYLQGHQDGLEWAAQMAEANHPQTGDWLYDDPIALAAAIRKGPDMPEFKSVSVDEDDKFYSWFGRFWHENYQQNNYTTSAKQMLGTMAEFAYRAGRESAARAGNSPATPDGWIPVSERMPEREVDVQVYCSDKKEQMVGYMERNEKDGWFRFASLPNGGGVYCNPTHWMPLQDPPKELG